MILEIERSVWQAISDYAKLEMGFIEGDQVWLHWTEIEMINGKRTIIDRGQYIKAPVRKRVDSFTGVAPPQHEDSQTIGGAGGGLEGLRGR